jgi:hypothetical protein
MQKSVFLAVNASLPWLIDSVCLCPTLAAFLVCAVIIKLTKGLDRQGLEGEGLEKEGSEGIFLDVSLTLEIFTFHSAISSCIGELVEGATLFYANFFPKQGYFADFLDIQ